MRGRVRQAKHALFHLAVGGLQLLARGLPRAAALRAFAGIADAVRLVDRPAVQRSRRHLMIAFGDAYVQRNGARIVRAMFRATGRNLVDPLRPLPRDAKDVEALVRFEGFEHLRSALQRDRGVILLSAHLGNWEVLAGALAARGIPLHVLAHRVLDERAYRMLCEWREHAGITVIPRDGGLLRATFALRRGAVVGFLVDQDIKGPSVFVDFFGKRARTPRAPFVLARRTGAALVPAWIRMTEEGRHVASVLPELVPSAHPHPERAIEADVRAWHAHLESAIRETPEQWVWHHRRWRTSPPEAIADLREFSRRLSDPVRSGATTNAAVTR